MTAEIKETIKAGGDRGEAPGAGLRGPFEVRVLGAGSGPRAPLQIRATHRLCSHSRRQVPSVERSRPPATGKSRFCRAGGGRAVAGEPSAGVLLLLRGDALWGLPWTPTFHPRPIPRNCSTTPRSVGTLAASSKLNSFLGPYYFPRGVCKCAGSRARQSQAVWTCREGTWGNAGVGTARSPRKAGRLRDPRARAPLTLVFPLIWTEQVLQGLEERAVRAATLSFVSSGDQETSLQVSQLLILPGPWGHVAHSQAWPIQPSQDLPPVQYLASLPEALSAFSLLDSHHL